jgi:phosphatidylserine/phosphatidylglycerophosphate/cardiolipin synthase-like enzyme
MTPSPKGEADHRHALVPLGDIGATSGCPFEHSPNGEHRKYLDRALNEAKKRVLIVSPWIRYEVVNDELITRFRKLLQRGVELWIAYGINKDGGHGRGKIKDEGDRDAERKLRRLGEDYPELFHMTRLGDTHAKVLVCDSRFSIITSFNWLSFRGDEQLEFRDERGYYVGLSERVEELFESYRVRFDSQARRRANG